jgi:Ig-like domain CHU_C associated/Secretion system C-terminal sorting domain
MKNLLLILSGIFILGCINADGQTPATRSVILGIGRGTCSGGTNGVQNFTYNSGTNFLTQSGTICAPNLAAPGFSISRAVIDYNPKDQMLYYFRRFKVSIDPAPLVYDTYVYRWAPGTCPPAGPGLVAIDTFPGEYLTVAFDAAGNGWMIKFGPTIPYSLTMRKVDFTTGTVGAPQSIGLPTGVNLYTQNGDYLITPGGNLFFAYDNKLLTVNYQDYGINPLNATYIDTIKLPSAGQNLIGLAYAEGEFVGSFVKSSAPAACGYGEVNILTGNQTVITRPAGETFSSFDNSSVTSGIGVAKKLVSVTPTGTAGRYTAAYDIFVKNYGNYPVSNLQLIDSLQFINGLGNIVPGTVSSVFTNNPGLLNINAAYNGTTNATLLLPGQTLVNTPLANNNFTIRVTADITGITPGIIYYNSAVATGTGFSGASIRDSSTNGANPDLNLNEKPDDAGESVKTPFVITVAGEANPCANLETVLHNQDFNTAADQATMPVGSASAYAGSLIIPLPAESFVITNNASARYPAYWNAITDHSGGGRMMVVNADINNSVIYSAAVSGLCSNLKYSFSGWVANISNASQISFCNAVGGVKYPKLNFRVKDAVSGTILSSISTSYITTAIWAQQGMRFVLPAAYANIVLEIINEGEGGCGNDLAIDDIKFGLCDAEPLVGINNVSAGCLGSPASFTATLSDPSIISGTPDYQWQVSSDGISWAPIGGAPNNAAYTITSVTAGDINKYYRAIVAAAGNLGNLSCRYLSPSFFLTAKIASTAATTATKNKNNICPGIGVNLGITGGVLGTNAQWKWYTGSPGGTLIGSGATASVTPMATTTYYVQAEGDCNTTAPQAVTVFISCDIDKDKDGIPDYVESNMPAAYTNAYNTGYAGYKDNNNDYINDDFQADGDSDNDGIPNYLDATFTGRVDTNADGIDDRFDADLDGKINMLDLDSDNDGIPDVVEAYGVDTDGDGKIDNFTDTDGDGLSQNVDANNTGANNTGMGLGNIDFDGDGVPNFVDLDSDNDGIPDIVETGAADVNNNGKVDGVITDANGNGFADAYEGAVNAILKTGADVGGDGKADSYPNKNKDNDFRPNAYDMDSDGDGILDFIESGLPDIDNNYIVDGAIGTNGWSTSASGLATFNPRNPDADIYPDYLDIDDDNDGIPDNIEGQPTATYKLPGITDTDGDGLVNTYDNVTGFGGTGIQFYDNDGDTKPDYLDLDTDGDGSLDICEGNDWNLNGICDEILTLTGLDTDGDGLDNRFDSLNSITNLKGTSYMMGLNGSLTGDATPGAKATVQKKVPAQLDRDWRYVGVVLPVQFLYFAGNPQNNQMLLSWTILAAQEIDHFEIERSLNNIIYIKVAVATNRVKLNEQQSFGITDDISGVSSSIIYYRIKVIGKAGEIKYSNVLEVKLKAAITPVSIMPNPANDYVSIWFYAEKQGEVTIRLVDNAGKTVVLQKQKVSRGNNMVQLNGLTKYSTGVYALQVLVNNEIVTQKLILNK